MERSHSRRLETPPSNTALQGRDYEESRRSRSRTRRDSVPEYRRSRLNESRSSRDDDRLRALEREMDRERRRLQDLQDNLDKERTRLRKTVSNHREINPPQTRLSEHEHTVDQYESRSRRRPRSSSKNDEGPEPRRSRNARHSPRLDRSVSPTFTTKDLIGILSSLKNVPPQPSAAATPVTYTSNNHKNILPDFDPSAKSQRVDIWLNKVNECATVYGWDDKTTIHFAMQKLQGLAKTWYESLPSILYTWAEWQIKLTNAFPCEQNYGQILEDMLKRKSRINEPIEVYFYEKLALLNQCNIEGKRAVDCIIHGLTDRTMKSSATTLRCSQPEQLLQFLMSNKDTSPSHPFDRTSYKSRFGTDNNSASNNNYSTRAAKIPSVNSNIFCYNCKEKGHPFLKCPKPILKCANCNKMGHKTENCFSKSKDSKTDTVQKTLCISNTNPNSKFFKEITVNNIPTKCFIDFGSEVTLIRRSHASLLNLICSGETTALKGFGNEIVRTLGTVTVDMIIDEVAANVVCHVVKDEYLEFPMLVGQSFTEQSHVAVYKTADKLSFLDLGNEMPFSQTEINGDAAVKLLSISDINVCGLASVKSSVEPQIDGEILVISKIIGKPSQQLAVLGGVYPVNNGMVNILVSPVSSSCFIREGMILSRGTEVRVVNRIVTSVSEISEPCTIDKTQIRIGTAIEEPHREKLLVLLNRYRHCFASTLKQLGCTNTTEMTIELNNKKPIVYRPYRLSHKERDNVRTMIDDMLDAGIVRESVSEYASPIILVRKKDGKMRMCVDYRMLNSVTVKERYPMPNIEDEISRLSGQAYFVTLDLTSGYYQVPLSEDSRPLTSFVTPDGQYEFNRMPFGLANAPAVFQRMMHKVLGPARYDGATSYIDDVLVYGRNIDECLVRLEKVLQLLEGANLTLNLAKCEFLMDKVDYLGYEISVAGIRPGDKKIQSVVNFPCPIDQHTVRQFLGLVGYFRKFIHNFAALAHPLTKLLTKDAVWTWSHEQETAFKTLKDKLVTRPILAIFNPDYQTELHTDASKLGVGGVLLQKSPGDDAFRPVAYYSRKTSPEERNFHAYELETLAVICSLKKFRVYLLGQDFKIVTDCSALRSTFSKRDILPRVARWWLLMQEFQCKVEYRPGVKMAHVDALSRNPIPDEETAQVSEHYPSVMNISSEDWLHTLQLGDTELCRIRNVLESGLDENGLKYIMDNYIIKDNKLYRYLNGDKDNIRWVVPKGARWQLCRMNHDEIGHFGVEKTLERIKKSYWFSKMSRFVKKYVNACIECAYAKKNNTAKEGYLYPIAKIEVPFHTIHIDHLGPFVKSKRGNTHLLVIVDGFTKFVFAKPVRNTKTQSAIRVLEEIFYTFRVPDRIISDRGTCFTSHAFKRFCLDKGVKHILNAVASPRSNGQVERYNRTILNSLTAQNLNRDEREWDDTVGKVQWGLNNTNHKTTGRTPSEMMFGTCMDSEMNPRLNEVRNETRENCDLTEIREQAKKAIDKDQEKQKQRYDKGRKPARVYAEGELVKITKTTFVNDGKSKKLHPTYVGPYRVVSILGNDRYRLAAIPGLTGTKNKRQTTVAADRMLPWVNIAALEVNEDTSISDNDE